MGAQFSFLAVHISDNVLRPSWVLGGFVVMALLMIPAMMRVRDEEIPRLALLTAAFFVASSIHVPLGPTTVHLLLNGLLGVILGWRTGLAIPVGLALQAALLAHGGFSTIGVNACVMTIPALLCAGLFTLLRRADWLRHRWFRTALVAGVLMSWAALAICFLRLLLTNPRENWSNPDWGPAWRSVTDPAVLAGILSLGVIGAGIERRLETTPNVILGWLVGLTGVMLTLLLNACVLNIGGAEDWHFLVPVVFIAHLPVAVLEGVIMGFTVSFLSRVKPDLLVGWRPDEEKAPLVPVQERPASGVSLRSPALLLALAGLLLTASPAWAHRLDAEYKILADGRIRIESWFETGDSPTNATVQVFLPGDKLLVEGKVGQGRPVLLRADRTAPLRVVVNAGAGHRKELTISGKEDQESDSLRENARDGGSPRRRNVETPYKDLMVGIGFLLALGAFVLSLRNAFTLQEIRRSLRSVGREER